jgi:hypothetical protein
MPGSITAKSWRLRRDPSEEVRNADHHPTGMAGLWGSKPLSGLAV